jgi:hypothetical protein
MLKDKVHRQLPQEWKELKQKKARCELIISSTVMVLFYTKNAMTVH